MVEFLLLVHILLFLFSFSFTAGLGIFADKIAHTRDTKTIHAVFVTMRPLAIAGGIGWLLTGFVGAALAGAYGIKMSTPWLLYSYVAFVILLLNGFLLHLPWQNKVIAASASPDANLETLLHSPMHRVASVVSALSVLALLYLMTARPG